VVRQDLASGRNCAGTVSTTGPVSPGVNNVWLNVLEDHSGAGPAKLLTLIQNPKQANVSLGGGKVEAMFEESYREFVSLPSAKREFRMERENDEMYFKKRIE